jgi:hypothetical protein
MSNTFDISNKPKFIGSITKRELKKYVTSWGWSRLIEGGKGEFVEEIILDYLINIKKYSNIVKSKPNCSHDFHLLNEEDIRIDVRRFNSKDSMYLGYTSSMKKSRKNWQDKAKYLKRGGYFGAHINNKEINLYYLPAKFLLKNFYTDRLSIDLTLSWTLTDLLKKK